MLLSDLIPCRLSVLRNGRCWRKRAAALAVPMIFLTGCAMGSSDLRWAVVCPPLVKYNREEQRRVAYEFAALPNGSVIVGWLEDYDVLRAQVKECINS